MEVVAAGVSLQQGTAGSIHRCAFHLGHLSMDDPIRIVISKRAPVLSNSLASERELTHPHPDDIERAGRAYLVMDAELLA